MHHETAHSVARRTLGVIHLSFVDLVYGNASQTIARAVCARTRQ